MNVLKAGEVLEAVVSKPVMIEDLERMEILSPSGDQIGKVGRFKNLIQHVECDLVIFDQLKNIFFYSDVFVVYKHKSYTFSLFTQY